MDNTATPAPHTTPLQLLVCCDGTNNNLTGRQHDTNVVKLCELLAVAPDARRVLFYDPGVGNPAELPGATIADSLKRRSERIAGLAFGQGVYENIAECYRFLMHAYPPGLAEGEPPPQIFLLGFSRGAFTARAVAGLVNQFGLLQPQLDTMVTTLVHAYFSQRQDGDGRLKAIAAQLRALFGTPATRRVPLQFVGVWDTVAAVGMPPFTTGFTAEPRAAGKAFVHVRQALALDEQRAQFKARTYLDANGPFITEFGTQGSMQQLWFRGAHCDVGGGYTTPEAALSSQTLAWLVSEAVLCGLRLAPGGQPLDTPQAVTSALVQVLPEEGQPRPRRIHSESWSTPLWALTGLAVRPTDGPAREHPSVAHPPMHAPADTVWSQARPGRGLLLGAAVVLPLLFLWMGWLLSGHSPNPVHWLMAPLYFAQWQLTAWLDLGALAPLRFNAVPWAVLADLPFILAYAYVLAWFGTQGFARLAGLRRGGEATPVWLNRLGWALPVAVGADVLEDICTLGCWWLVRTGHETWAWLLSLPMATAALVKLGGLVAAAALALAAWAPWRRAD
jgi:uncharacterized protein (DUF2235 family)